jgi:large subunit ribosomal protein L17|tara:strand:+ start:393 stop:872 length:480 start_codon:yes stop_codon:yes gene_type:complete
MALLRNQSTMLLRHERIDTTLAKARELRPFVERLITMAKRGIADGADTTRALHARRLVARHLADKKVVGKLFDSIAPRFAERPGGYSRVLRLGRRKSDSAEIAQIELVGSEYDPAAESASELAQPEEAAPGVGGRLRAAATRLTGGSKGKSSTDEDAAE